MNWATWRPIYHEILADFGWDAADDAASAVQLQAMLTGNAWNHVGTELKHRAVATVVGCGPQLAQLGPQHLQGVVVAADGATARLREIGVVPRVVVTDLDGDLAALEWAANQGASIVVHAHGHNSQRLREFGPLTVGTCQNDPQGLAPLRNLGGFTDGDRAALLCEHYKVKHIRLAAFDTAAEPSSYSHQFNPATKRRKLAWCQRILDDLAQRSQVTFV